MTRKAILLIGIDGLRVDDALAPSRDDGSVAAPSLAAFVEGGRMHGVTMEAPTISGPGWSSILTGTPHSVHGVFDNSFHGHRLDAVLTRSFLAVHRYGGLPLEDGGATADEVRPEEVADLLLEHLTR